MVGSFSGFAGFFGFSRFAVIARGARDRGEVGIARIVVSGEPGFHPWSTGPQHRVAEGQDDIGSDSNDRNDSSDALRA